MLRQSDSVPPNGHFAMGVARRWHFISGGAHIFWVRLSWARRVFRSTRLEFLVRGLGALCERSAQLSQLHHMLRYVLDVTVACGGRVTCWTTHQGAPMEVPMCLNFLNITLCASGLSAVKVSSRQKRENISIALHDLTNRILPHMWESV